MIVTLCLLALPIASITWTVTHEEVFREPREWCADEKWVVPQHGRTKVLLFVHVRVLLQPLVTAIFLYITRYTLLFDDWRGYLIAGFSLVFIANIYMSLFGRLRLDIKGRAAGYREPGSRRPRARWLATVNRRAGSA